MQTVNQATEIISYVTGTHRGRARQIARALIDAGILPKSSGRDIKKITAKEMLPLFAAIAMAEKVADAAAVAREFSDLPMQIGTLDNDDLKFALSGANDLSALFAEVMNKDGNWTRASIEFSRVATGFTALIEGEVRNASARLSFEVALPFWRDPSMGHFYKTSFKLMEEGIEVMRNLFAREDIEGMSFKMDS